MGQLANEFSTIFREEHRAVRDSLFELADAFRQRTAPSSREILGRIAMLTGPHFRYEEEVMYPALVQIFGRKYIEKLYRDHDRVIGSAERLVILAGKAAWTDEEVGQGIELILDILPHVSDCDGLSIMVERLPEDAVQAILDARERSNSAGIDLLRWAKEIRKPAQLPN